MQGNFLYIVIHISFVIYKVIQAKKKNCCKINWSVGISELLINLFSDLSRLITNIAWKNICPVALLRFSYQIETLNDLVNEHLVVIKRIQVLLLSILLNSSITMFYEG